MAQNSELLYVCHCLNFIVPLQVDEEEKEAIPMPMDLESPDFPELDKEEATPATTEEL